MSSETIVTAIFLITAIVAAGVLASQVLPAVYSMSSTFSSSSNRVDEQIRTDLAIVNTFANTSRYTQVWITNTGDARIREADLDRSIVFTGSPTDFTTVDHKDTITAGGSGWRYDILATGNYDLDPGETMRITTYHSSKNPASSGASVYFQFVLPNGVKRSDEFTVS